MRDRAFRRAQIKRVVARHIRDIRTHDAKSWSGNFEAVKVVGGKAKDHPMYCGCLVCQSTVDGLTHRQASKRERQAGQRAIAEQLA